MRMITVFLMLGCISEKPSEPPPLTNSPATDDSCGGQAPIVDSLTCSNTGIQYSPDNGDLPTFSLQIHATDDDGDLDSYTAQIYFDTELDGQIGTDAETLITTGTVSQEPCTIDEATINLTIFLQGGAPNYETEYEWHVELIDSLGEVSEPYGTVCTTPNSDGEGEP